MGKPKKRITNYIPRHSCEYCGFTGDNCVCGKITHEEYVLLLQGKLSGEIDKRGHIYIARAYLQKSAYPVFEDGTDKRNFVAIKQTRGLIALRNWMVVIKRVHPEIQWFRVYDQTRQTYKWKRPIKDFPLVDETSLVETSLVEPSQTP